MPNVVKIENLYDFMYEITFDSTEDMRSYVFDFAHDNQLKILQLNQKNASLESLFETLLQINLQKLIDPYRIVPHPQVVVHLPKSGHLCLVIHPSMIVVD